MKKLLLHSIFPVILLWVTACAGQPSTPIVSPPDIPSDHKYIPTDPGTPLEVSSGKEFYIAVASNPTTGYHWEVANKWDEKVMALLATEYQSQNPQGLVGAGGMDIWHFKAVGAGEVQFVISYFPPGNNTTPEKTQTFMVRVK